MNLDTRIRSDALVVWTIRLVVLVAFLDLFMQVPVISTYAQSLGAGAAMVGWIVGTYSVANILGNAGAGALLDRLNRKRLIVVGMLLTAASLYVYTLVASPVHLLTLRAFHGLAAGVLAPGAFAMLGDRAAGQHARSMGVSGAMVAISAVIGPPLAGIIGDAKGFEAVFATSGTLMLLAAVAFWVSAPGSARLMREPAAVPAEDGRRAASPLRDGTLLRVYCSTLVMTFSIGALVTHLPIVVDASAAGGSSRLSGMAFATFSLVAVAVMASPVHRAIDGRSRALSVGVGLCLLSVSGLTLAFFSVELAAVFSAMVVFGLGFGLLFPSLSASVSERSGSDRRGAAFGIFYAIYSLGVVIGSVVSGQVYGHVGELGAPFLASAAVALLAIPIALRVRVR